jgi:ubiquinone/menaquinone biosynthesis C-methylase UbiE
MSKYFLHVGCGPHSKINLKGFESWHEVRLDIDPLVYPDIVGTLTDMSGAKTSGFGALYSSHNIEHVYPHEVPTVLKEFHRVLDDDGFVVITCPDLQSVGAQLAMGRLIEPLYESPAGPISALDIIYGHRGFIANGNHYMAHKSGFTFPVLSRLFSEAGFAQTYGAAMPQTYDIWMLAFKKFQSDKKLLEMAKKYLP